MSKYDKHSKKEHFKRKWKQNNEYQKNLTFEKQNRENISKIQEDIQPEHRKLRRKITHKTLVANEGLSINDTTNKKNKGENRKNYGYVFCNSCSFEAKCICASKELKREKTRKCFICGGILTFTFTQKIVC